MRIPDPEAFAETIPATTWARWQLFYGLEPWGALPEELRAGKVAAAFYNANPFRGKGSKAVSPTEFVPAGLLPPRPPQDWRALKASLKSFVQRSGGEVLAAKKEPAGNG